tara:strand:+ start:1953 stop:2414 length:462 start_codon:yes stop_codon:yes gene_type:complete
MARGDLKTFDYYPYNAGLKLYNNSTDSFKYAIVTDAYAAVLKTTVDPVLTSFTEVGAGGNYSAGGNALAGVAWTIGVVSAGVTALDFTDVSMLKAAGNPTTGKTVLIINSTATNRGYHAIDLTSDGTTAVDLVNNDLTITFNANGTVNATVTA